MTCQFDECLGYFGRVVSAVLLEELESWPRDAWFVGKPDEVFSALVDAFEFHGGAIEFHVVSLGGGHRGVHVGYCCEFQLGRGCGLGRAL
jgi:hypothetical protein